LVTLVGVSKIQTLHITDFGVSQFVSDGNAIQGQIGTEKYMAPGLSVIQIYRVLNGLEVKLGGKYNPFPADSKSILLRAFILSVWSLGVVMVKIISGHREVTHESFLKSDNCLVSIVQNCLSSNPNDRSNSKQVLQQCILSKEQNE